MTLTRKHVSWSRLSLLVLLLLALALCAPGVDARDATVRTKDGAEFTGELVTQNDKVVVLRISGIETPIPRDKVAELELQPTAQEVFDEVRPTLEDSDLVARLDLANRVYRMGDLELARRELADLARLFPGEPRIGQLDRIIEADQELARQKSERRTADRPRDGQTPRGTPHAADRPEDTELLTPEQVNLIRVYEIDLAEEPRGIRISRETLTKFFEVFRDDNGQPLDRRGRAAFQRKPGYEQLEAFFKAQARDLYGQIEIINDPPALARFRNQVNPQYIARYFHKHFGQGQVEGLKLYATRPNSVEEAYTNFFNLHAYPAGETADMIDRVVPEDSLLIQWGLPRENAKSPAPQVEGWAPAFRSIDDPQVQQLIQWIRLLYSPAPDYGIAAPGPPPAEPADPDAPAPPPAQG